MRFLRRWVGRVKFRALVNKRYSFTLNLREQSKNQGLTCSSPPTTGTSLALPAPRTVRKGMGEQEAKDCSGQVRKVQNGVPEKSTLLILNKYSNYL